MAETPWSPQYKSRNIVPPIDHEEIAQVRDMPSINIWNMAPREFIEDRGSLGRFIIPACKPGEPVSEPLRLPGFLFETALDALEGSDKTYKWLKTSGAKLAKDLIGQGPSKDSSQDLSKWGVFISAGPYPTEEELETARERLFTNYSERVRRADQLYEVNGGMELDAKGIPHSAITKDDIEAAKALNLDRPWVRKQGKMMECENCGKSNVPTASRCVQCQAVFDEVKDRRLFPRDYQTREVFVETAEPKRGPGRPRAEVAA